VLSVARGGRTIDEDVHPIQVGLDFGRGYVLCEACGVLADLPSTLTLNWILASATKRAFRLDGDACPEQTLPNVGQTESGLGSEASRHRIQSAGGRAHAGRDAFRYAASRPWADAGDAGRAGVAAEAEAEAEAEEGREEEAGKEARQEGCEEEEAGKEDNPSEGA
jgi:hypothetical protein